jgi:DNA-directed RNA polymerase subunit RPC12/RpoP
MTAPTTILPRPTTSAEPYPCRECGRTVYGLWDDWYICLHCGAASTAEEAMGPPARL